MIAAALRRVGFVGPSEARADRDACASEVRAALARLGIAARVDREGPHGATVRVEGHPRALPAETWIPGRVSHRDHLSVLSAPDLRRAIGDAWRVSAPLDGSGVILVRRRLDLCPGRVAGRLRELGIAASVTSDGGGVSVVVGLGAAEIGASPSEDGPGWYLWRVPLGPDGCASDCSEVPREGIPSALVVGALAAAVRGAS